jgi:GT2 family glycosyltransferase
MPIQAPRPDSTGGCFGFVVIGRNEGRRLCASLASVAASAAPVVYVDSGSIDGSVALARAAAADVLELDQRLPFTAARARNEGCARLIATEPEIAYVMFLDGDCELHTGWMQAASEAIERDPAIAVVAGRLRERYPEASIYNRLCDMEWRVPPGEVRACGGVALYRVEAFQQAGGFNAAIIAGEEPELCLRLRRLGWRILRIEADMALHDAAMTRFGQWWTRAVRAGHAYAEGAAMHGAGAEHHFVRECASGWIFSAAVPIAAVTAAAMAGAWGLAVLAAYPALFVKIALGRRRTYGEPWKFAGLYAAACIIAKPAECLGQLRYWTRRALGRRPRLLEHKPLTGG